MEAIARPGTLVQQVLAVLKKEIDAGRFPPSSRLPAEQVLAGELGVSRPVVREAISQLKADGVLTTRKGSGAYVAANPAGNVFRLPVTGAAATDDRDDPAQHNLLHLFELRFWTEIAAAEMAALRRTPDDLAAMRTAIQAMEDSKDNFRAASAADVALHHAIAGATHNPYLQAFTEFVGGQLLQTREVAWKNSASHAGGSSAAQREHGAIYAAIEAGDAMAARTAARAHLLAAARRMRLDVTNLDHGETPA